jgi:Zn-dependent protease with chaperone function
MDATATSVGCWLAQTVLGGGLLLLLARGLMAWTAQPARRQRLGEWALAAALVLPLLSLAPALWVVQMPVEEPPPTAPSPAIAAGPAAADPRAKDSPRAAPLPEAVEPPAVRPEPSSRPPAPALTGVRDTLVPPDLRDKSVPHTDTLSLSQPEADRGLGAPSHAFAFPSAGEWLRWGLLAYAASAALLLGHWLLGQVGLWRLLRHAVPAPQRLTRALAEMTPGRPAPRLLVSGRVRVPFSCGLSRPTIVLPARLCAEGSTAAVRWVLAHELAHLERRDARTGLLLGLGRVLYFPFPWFWGLGRQLRLCQEYVADSAAAAVGRPEDYAQFLLAWAAAPAPPAGTAGVFGHHSDLLRRITMLLKSSVPVERRCPRRWSLTAAAGLLALAALVAGVRLQAGAAPQTKDEPKKDEPKKVEPKKDQPKKDDRAPNEFDPFMPNFDDLFKGFKGMDPEQVKKLREQWEQAQMQWRKAAEQGRFGHPGMAFGFDRGGHGRLGVMVRPPSETLTEQLDLPKGQGLVVESVQADSAAAKAGLKPHDVLLELNGKAVPDDPREFVKQLNDVKANTAVDAVVLRKGKKETVKGLTLPEAKAAVPEDNRFEFFTPRGKEGGNFGFFPGDAPGGRGGKGPVTTTMLNNDRFTSTYKDGDLSITVTGKIEDGKPKLGEVQVKDGGKTEKYESLDKVPEKYRDQVKALMEVTGKDRLEINKK